MHSCGLCCKCKMGLMGLLACEHRRISEFCFTPPKNNSIFWRRETKSGNPFVFADYMPNTSRAPARNRNVKEDKNKSELAEMLH